MLALGIASLALPASALAQATRTWVSGTGDDVNPCSRTAPCKTWAGAISKTATGGEIDVLDPGGFGTLTITKSITIDGKGNEASALSSGINGINITNFSATDEVQRRVIIRNIEITGGLNANLGVKGINISGNPAQVHLDHVKIWGFTTCGVCMQPSSTPSKLTIDDSMISDNPGTGVLLSPGTGGTSGSFVRATIRNSAIYGNGGSGVGTTSSPGPNKVSANLFSNGISDNATNGLLVDGVGSMIHISQNAITGNGQGLKEINSGQILSWQDNQITDNGIDGVPTGTLPQG